MVRLKHLLSSATLKEINFLYKTNSLICHASNFGNFEAVKMLIEYGADINRVGNRNNALSLLSSIVDKTTNQMKIFKYILNLPDIDINCKVVFGTPLIIATLALKRVKFDKYEPFDPSNQLETIKLLLEYGANPYATDKYDRNTFDIVKNVSFKRYDRIYKNDEYLYDTYDKEILNILNKYKK